MLAIRLVSLRKKHKFTHQDMAEKLGITRQAYSNYENGKREPDYDTLEKIADIFKVNIDYLLGRTDDPSLVDSKNETDELTTIMFHKWDQLDERRRKQALKLIEILEQEADEENNKG